MSKIFVYNCRPRRTNEAYKALAEIMHHVDFFFQKVKNTLDGCSLLFIIYYLKVIRKENQESQIETVYMPHDRNSTNQVQIL